MKIYSEEFYADPLSSGNFYVQAECLIDSPDSGFSLSLGKKTGTGNFQTGVSFSGISGYLFDNEGNFFGGYYKNRQFNLEFHCFSDRMSYFYNDILMANNISIQNNFNRIEFDKPNDSSIYCNLFFSNIPTDGGLKDFYGISLLSHDNFVLEPL